MQVHTSVQCSLTTVSALDVEELLHPNIRSKARLCHNHSILPHQFECQHVRQDGGITVGNIGKGPRMDQDRVAL